MLIMRSLIEQISLHDTLSADCLISFVTEEDDGGGGVLSTVFSVKLEFVVTTPRDVVVAGLIDADDATHGMGVDVAALLFSEPFS